MPTRLTTNHRTPDEAPRSAAPEVGWLDRQPSATGFNTPAPEIAQQIDDIAQLLGDVDARSADRLDELANAVSNAEGRHRWSDVDLRRAFNTDRLAHAYAVKREGGYAPRTVEIADKLRNVLVLVPILLTWWALGAAVSNWADFEEANPDSGMSFLVAWEQGFGGLARWWEPSLSHVAYVDAVLILIIILLTFYAHGRAEEQEDKIADTASLFQADMDNALAEASVLLATDRSSRPVRLADAVERMAESFEASSAAMLNQLQVEHDRMEIVATRREHEVHDFGTFATSMRAGADEMQRVLGGLREVARGLETGIADMSGDLARSAEQQRALLLAVSNLERLTSSSIQNDQAAVRQLTTTVTRLGETAERTIAGAESATSASRLAMEAVASVAEITRDLGTSQGRIESILAAQNTASAQFTDSMAASGNAAAQTARQLGEIGNGLAAIQHEFAGVAQQNARQIATLSKLVDGQTSSEQELTNLVREIGGIAMSTAQRQREVNDQLQHLTQRLDSIASSLERIIGQPSHSRNDRTEPTDPDASSTAPAPARWSRTRG